MNLTHKNFLRFTVVAAMTAAPFIAPAAAKAQQPTMAASSTTPVPEAIADPLLRQILPAMQTRNGLLNTGWWEHHQRNLADLATQTAKGSVHLLFVGDSITDNYHKAGPAPDQVFKPIWDEFFAPHGAFNLGVSGDSTQHVLWRLENGEADGLAPENIVVLIGTNNTWHDGSATADEVAEGIKAVLYELHALMPKAKILTLGILPTTVNEEKSAKDAEINKVIATEFEQVPWVQTLDIGKLFLKPDGSVDQSLFYDMPAPCKGPSCDPNAPPAPRHVVHPNTVGQRRMAEAVSAAVYGPQKP